MGLALSGCYPELHGVWRPELTMVFAGPPVSTQGPRAAGGFTAMDKTSLLYGGPSVVANQNSVSRAPLSPLNERSLRDH